MKTGRTSPTLILLLNLAILLANFAVSWGTNETQTRVLRSTARIFHEVPRGRSLRDERSPRDVRGVRTGEETFARPPDPGDGARPDRVGAVRRTRLFKYLARVPGIDGLGSAQLGAVYRSLERSCDEFGALGGRLGRLEREGRQVRALLVASQRRLRADVERSLRGAAIPDGRMLDQLVRIVVASAG